MIRMGITGDMSISSALELFPQLFPLFQQIGMCCVNDENANLTVNEICRQCHVDTDSFLEAAASVVG